MEIFFDSFYLIFALSLGARMFFLKGEGKNLLASMTFLLAFGDIFHLVPRILKALGGENLGPALSLGTKVSSLTMCLFYLLFYIYIKKRMEIKNKGLDFCLYLLTALRLITVLLNFKYQSDRLDLYSNIPFTLQGLIVIVLLYKYREVFKKNFLLVIISFACYIPVVLFKRTYPMVGALMIPKTIAYIFIIVGFYKSLEKNQSPLPDFALASLVMALFSGVFYDVFTKVFFESEDLLRIHPHLMILGLVLPILMEILLERKDKDFKEIGKLFSTYQTGLFLTMGAFFLRGLAENGNLIPLCDRIITGLMGLGHTLLGLSLIFIFKKLLEEKTKKLN